VAAPLRPTGGSNRVENELHLPGDHLTDLNQAIARKPEQKNLLS